MADSRHSASPLPQQSPFVQHTHSLAKHLKTSLGWHQSRIDLIALVIFGLIQMGSVNLSRIARTMGHATEIDSRRKRLKRFFA
ncbi:hypothetical protein [Endozoicomonas sp. 8E]|uniref:hypothetical protein n=1 Tax=Endozoicomonas sp. 8E TaxID=3035692 RepID=UPI0029394E40|nr:hypothetical protein [Endozoicomonas sp. 8E]WOG27611.1 hypothetical protein P6910_24195 [Endozoicomonas sp. 8E]